MARRQGTCVQVLALQSWSMPGWPGGLVDGRCGCWAVNYSVPRALACLTCAYSWPRSTEASSPSQHRVQRPAPPLPFLPACLPQVVLHCQVRAHSYLTEHCSCGTTAHRSTTPPIRSQLASPRQKGHLRSRRRLRECTRPSYLPRVRLLQPAAPGSEYHADLACHSRPPRSSASSSLATP